MRQCALLVVGEWETYPDLTSMIVLGIGATYGVQTYNLWIQMKSLLKKNCHLQLLSHFLALKLLLLPDSTYKQNKTKENKLQPSLQLFPT
jgi:hypothetical protein